MGIFTKAQLETMDLEITRTSKLTNMDEIYCECMTLHQNNKNANFIKINGWNK